VSILTRRNLQVTEPAAPAPEDISEESETNVEDSDAEAGKTAESKRGKQGVAGVKRGLWFEHMHLRL